ncbi:platelet binding protein GspB isoform X1 [Eurosta solidaginis]|uniref:platelet binding protein GspB isoform X1 n=1 Tax=Eurosta solidaginis TaxID=178769 RepID=UPI0035313575
MEHLDLAGVIGAPTIWNMPAFDQQDAIYLSSSRQMLEPILEETSEDEEHAQNSWSQYEQSREHFWSSTESETGSVIRIEISKDPDSISERDFACPAKRARRCDEFVIGGQLPAAAQAATQQPVQQSLLTSYDDTVLLRRTQRPFDYNEANSNSLERFLAYEACTRDSWGQQTQQIPQQRNSTGSRRFDDFADSDSISYHSLSRSSSLIQFESLERQLQLQEQHASMSSLGNSSPSLLGFDGARSTSALNAEEDMRSGANSGSNSGNNSRRGSQSSLLKRFESSDGRLHQTYFDLDKLDFDDDQRVLFGSNKTNSMGGTVGEVRSDSESSTSSGSSSGNSILTTSKPSAEDLTDSSCTVATRAGRIIAYQRAGKSSAENLSEDSGYCEPSTLRRAKSKSIPKNFEKFCEEEEEIQQHDYIVQRYEAEDVDSSVVTKTTHNQQAHSKNNPNYHNNNINTDIACTNHYVLGHDDDDICQPKINDATFNVTTDGEASLNAPTTTTVLPTLPSSPQTKTSIGYNGGECEKKADENECDLDHFVEEHNVDIEHIGVRYISACPRFERVKNSTMREGTNAANTFLLEQQRSLAHSPSPVASDISSTSSSASSSPSSASSDNSCGTARSNTSASTCASAASFTWLPTTRKLQQQPHQLQLQLERTQRQTSAAASAKLELIAAHQRSSLENFCTSLRNSLPDIRDALSTTTCNTVLETNFPIFFGEHNGSDVSNANDHGLEHVRNTEAKTAEKESLDTERADGGAAKSAAYNLDDSDFSTTSPVTSARESHTSDETDNEYTPEAKKRQRGGSGAIGRCVVGSYVSSGRRIASVPSELNKLGRKKRVSTRHRHSKSSEDAANEISPSNSSVDEAEDEDFFDVGASLKIRRSCSWSERRERNLQRFEAAFSNKAPQEGDKHWITQSLGYMNASYQNLTQLDYSGNKREGSDQRRIAQSNLKRNSDSMDTQKGTASTDYEHIICKGNFLLDELSQIYDRNASILTDKPINAEDQLLPFPQTEDYVDRPSCSPRPPPRQRKHSHSSYSDLDSVSGVSVNDCANEHVDAGAVQHVQLTIRKPPARQKHARKSEATNSLISDTGLLASETTPTTNTSSVSYGGKTFDQDPTNLRTSYAQSLEKCNFDTKELSNTELNKTPNALPKRRFHSQANATQQRNMVSSTPNLNAFDPHDDDLEDDIYVSSAHTSMHQLPQATTQKPLGILLSAGSRTSFSKEVSFCPVVSQYSWQEQSSEEQQAADAAEVDEKQDEETDDELLDNADATVIQNTRVNEMIAARYAAELKSALASGNATKNVAQLRAVPIEKVRAMIIVKECQAAEEQLREQASNSNKENQQQQQVESVDEKTSHKATDYSADTKGEALKLDSNTTDDTTTAATTAIETFGVETSPVNVSHKPTIIDSATRIVEAEQTTVNVQKVNSNENRNNKAENDVNTNKAQHQSNRHSSLTGFSEGGASSSNDNASNRYSAVSGIEQTRPLSLHLPILSEPPINRAHHILYASQQLLDNFERRESEKHEYYNQNTKCESALGGGVGVVDRRTKSVNNLSAGQNTTRYKMSNTTMSVGGGQSGSGVAAANNNNELLNKKFKDEKHPSSKGFLSRFAHGLRFSLRRKNKKQLQQQQQQQPQFEEHVVFYEQHSGDKSTMRKSFGKSLTLPQLKQQQPQLQQTKQQQTSVQQLSSAPNKSKRSSAQSGPDFIYIPLKGPIPPAGTLPPSSASVGTAANGGTSSTLPANFSPPGDAEIDANGQTMPAQNNYNNSNVSNNTTISNGSNNSNIKSNRGGSDNSDMCAITDRYGEPLVTGKPPKPYRYGSIPATTSSTTIITKYFGSGRKRAEGGGGSPAHAQKDSSIPQNVANFKSRSQFYTDFLDAERSYYNDDEIEKQLDVSLQANGSVVITSTPRSNNASHVNHAQNSTHVSAQKKQLQKQNSLRETLDTCDENAVTTTKCNFIVEYETPSTAKELAQIAYCTPGVARETVMLLTSGVTTGSGGGGGLVVGANTGNDVAPTYTTMSNAYMQHTNNEKKIGLIETNLDTHETVISGKTRSLVDIVGPQHNQQQYGVVDNGDGGAVGVGKRLNMSAACGGNMDFDENSELAYGHNAGGRGGGGVVIKSTTANGSQIASVRRPHKSMEFLLDKENQKNVLPPENELQKSHDHNPAALSEHQLRVQASLQRLNIPDWFRQYNQNTSRSPEGNSNVYKPGNFTRKRTTESGRWAGLNSKTTSLSSLGSQRSDRSPLLLSPSAHSHHGGQVAQQHGTAGTSVYGTTTGAGAFSRWSTSHLNSSQTSPSVSQRGSFTRGGPINSSFISVASGQNNVIRSSYRQPYLGWRSQEKLSQRTPHERLASSLLAQQQRTTPTQRSTNVAANGDATGKLLPVTPEIQSSIKEVTSAIVHFVNDQTQQQQQQQQRSRSASPNSRKCWLESSFVGIRPLDSPQTPVIESTETAFSSATNTAKTTANNSISSQYNSYTNYNYNYNISNSSTNTLTAITTPNSIGGIGINTAITTNPHVLRMNGLSIIGGGESAIMI